MLLADKPAMHPSSWKVLTWCRCDALYAFSAWSLWLSWRNYFSLWMFGHTVGKRNTIHYYLFPTLRAPELWTSPAGRRSLLSLFKSRSPTDSLCEIWGCIGPKDSKKHWQNIPNSAVCSIAARRLGVWILECVLGFSCMFSPVLAWFPLGTPGSTYSQKTWLFFCHSKKPKQNKKKWQVWVCMQDCLSVLHWDGMVTKFVAISNMMN